MKFIAHHLNLIGLVLLASFIAAAAGLYFQAPERAKAPQPKAAAAAARFVCPMHPNVTRATQTGCPECGMKLVALGRERAEANANQQQSLKTRRQGNKRRQTGKPPNPQATNTNQQGN